MTLTYRQKEEGNSTWTEIFLERHDTNSVMLDAVTDDVCAYFLGREAAFPDYFDRYLSLLAEHGRAIFAYRANREKGGQ